MSASFARPRGAESFRTLKSLLIVMYNTSTDQSTRNVFPQMAHVLWSGGVDLDNPATAEYLLGLPEIPLALQLRECGFPSWVRAIFFRQLAALGVVPGISFGERVRIDIMCP